MRKEEPTTGNGQVTTYSYDTWLGLSGMDQPGTPYDQAYTRDYTGKITSWTKGTANALAFSYDGLGRLASGEGVNYGYDTTGNMTTAAGGDPSAFAYQVGTTGNSMLIDSTSGTATVDYSTDTEGNVVQATGRFGTISYDFSNRITSIADTVRGTTDSYAYDASGFRYRKTVSVAGTQVQTFTVYSGNDILLEETYSEGAWKTARIEFSVAGAAAGRFEKDYSTSQEAIRYYYQDHLGSRVGVVDESGAVLATMTYDIWGNATASGIAGYDATRDIRFTGKPIDATGLYYFNARYYDPQSKRFLTEDPIQQGMNWYTYCGNDPVNATDPDGRVSVKEDPNERLSGADKTARDNFDSNGREGNVERLRDVSEREHSPVPLPQTVLPNSPSGINEACFFRAIIRIAEEIAGFFLTREELNDIWDAAIDEDVAFVKNDGTVLDWAGLFKMGLEAVGIGGGNPSFSNKPADAVGSIIRLSRFGEKIETGVSSVYRYTRSMHAQTGNAYGEYSSDPWGENLARRFTNGKEVLYAHW